MTTRRKVMFTILMSIVLCTVCCFGSQALMSGMRALGTDYSARHWTLSVLTALIGALLAVFVAWRHHDYIATMVSPRSSVSTFYMALTGAMWVAVAGPLMALSGYIWGVVF